MVKQLILPLVAVAAFVVFVGWFVKKAPELNFNLPGAAETPAPTKIVKIGSTNIKVELANTPALRTKGLSGSSSLDAGSGMLFIFDKPGTNPSFWMKDMLIPIDIIWIRSSVVSMINKDAQPPIPGTPDNQLRIYSNSSLTDYVLEVNAGFADKNNIKVGDSVTLPAL